MKIGFIGLGHMGNPMARNLLKHGHTLKVFDVVPELVKKLTGLGAESATSPATCSQGVELVITMLPSSPHVRSVYTGKDTGILSGVPPGVLLIDSSTIDPHTARDVAIDARAHGNNMVDAPVSGGTGGAEAGTLTFMVGGDASDFEKAKPILQCMGKNIVHCGGAGNGQVAKICNNMVDAPVSGGTGGAEAGTLTFMVGGDAADFEKAKPILQCMGKNIVHCGGAGNGQVAKICNNMMLAIEMIATAEGMALAAKLGMDPKVFAGVANSSSGRCWSSDTYNPYPGVLATAPSSGGYTGGFGSDLMLKDLTLVTEAAKAAKQPVVLGAAAQQLYQMHSSMGNGALDFSSIIKLYKVD